MTVKDGKAERQKNVPISETYHRELQAISLIEKKPMKEVVEGYIIKDGRGKTLLEKADSVETDAAENDGPVKSAEPAESPNGTGNGTAATR